METVQCHVLLEGYVLSCVHVYSVSGHLARISDRTVTGKDSIGATLLACPGPGVEPWGPDFLSLPRCAGTSLYV